MDATDLKDWLTSAAIIAGGLWAIWRFSHQERLRIRSEIPSLEGSTSPREVVAHTPDRCIVSLRWTWRNAGSRPVFIDCENSQVRIFRLRDDVYGIIDPRQNPELLGDEVACHTPLSKLEPYMFEPGTSSSLLTPVVLPFNGTYVARMVLYSDKRKHAAPGGWPFTWERWQIFRTELEAPSRPATA